MREIRTKKTAQVCSHQKEAWYAYYPVWIVDLDICYLRGRIIFNSLSVLRAQRTKFIGCKDIFMRKSIALLYLLMPSILLSLNNYIISNRMFGIYLIFLYLITIVGIALFFIFKFHRSCLWVLLLGLLLSPTYTILFEYRDRLGLPPYLHDFGIPYVGTTLSIIYYVLPFMLLSIITFAFLKHRENKCPK